MNVRLTPHPLAGAIDAPASKSYAHRMLIAAYLAGAACTVVGAGNSEDVEATLGALAALGLAYSRTGDDISVEGAEVPDKADVYCRESGSTLRFLLPVAAALGVRATFGGEAGLLRRPIGGLVDVLNAHGARIEGLTVGGRLSAGDYVVDAGVSSQYVTGLLFALPLLDGDSRILYKDGKSVSQGYVDVTLDILRQAGVRVHPIKGGYAVAGRQTYRMPQSMTVEGDWSGAAFMLAAGAIGGKTSVRRLNGNSIQGDRAILPLLQRFGARISQVEDVATVEHRPLKGIEIDVDGIPDLAQILSVVAAYAEGTTILHNVARLRYKESDRAQAILDMLGKAGVACRIDNDDLYIEGGRPRGGAFDGGNDHRTVMSACILAAGAEGDSTVEGAEAMAKSYPRFLEDFVALGGKIDGNV